MLRNYRDKIQTGCYTFQKDVLMVSRRLKTIVLWTIRWEKYYHPECARGIRWNDPSIGIVWPVPDMIISEKDKNYEDFKL